MRAEPHSLSENQANRNSKFIGRLTYSGIDKCVPARRCILPNGCCIMMRIFDSHRCVAAGRMRGIVEGLFAVGYSAAFDQGNTA